mmetsp:Transcript_104801/g.272712  ORF Transcript_104801/g.272712 Transcript_104801/m.272712 type:complete len:100 (+) Transcript_104801:2-301(+)
MTFADRLKMLTASWAVANKNAEEELSVEAGEEHADDAEVASTSEEGTGSLVKPRAQVATDASKGSKTANSSWGAGEGQEVRFRIWRQGQFVRQWQRRSP